MTKIEELEQKLNECQKELAELKESKKEGKWKPKHNEEYYFRGTNGYIENTLNYDSEYDDWRINNIPIFKTEEECRRYWRFMDTVKEKSYEFSTDEWRNVNITKWRMGYNFQDGEWEILPLGGYYIPRALYFKNKSDAQYIIDNFKDELMEYFL